MPIVSFQSNGGGMRCEVAVSPHMRGTSRASTASSWVMPIVATVRTSRDALANRLTSENSTTAPSATAAMRPMPKPKQVGEAGEEDQADGERGRDEPEVGLGEVDDPVGAVDERHAHRQQRGEEAEDDAADPRAHRHAEPDELDGDQCDGRRERTDVSHLAIRAPACDGHPHVERHRSGRRHAERCRTTALLQNVTRALDRPARRCRVVSDQPAAGAAMRKI